MGTEEILHLSCVWGLPSLLLDVPMWFSDMPCLYGRKSLGDELQRDHVDLPGLWTPVWVWESVISSPRGRREWVAASGYFLTDSR